MIKMQLDVEESTPASDILISPQNCNRQLLSQHRNSSDLQLEVENELTYTLVQQIACLPKHILQDMNYDLVLSFGKVTTDGQKAMHKSPSCIRTGVLKNYHKLK